MLHHEDHPGKEPPIVLLHGILESGASWSRVATRLVAAGRRTLLIDSRGHGASEPWTPGMSWAPMEDARDVVELLERVAPQGAHLVGHSRGGTTASWIAAERPDLARSLTLVASPPQVSEAFRAHFRKGAERASSPRARSALAYLASIPEDDFPTLALRRYRGPALIIEAADDPLYGPTQTLFWRAFLPYAAMERIEGGHDLLEEDESSRWIAERLLRHVEEAERVA